MLEQNDYRRGTKEFTSLEKLKFESIWAIGLFTHYLDFCSVYQAELRDQCSGCKWSCMRAAIQNGIQSLHFVQRHLEEK